MDICEDVTRNVKYGVAHEMCALCDTSRVIQRAIWGLATQTLNPKP